MKLKWFIKRFYIWLSLKNRDSTSFYLYTKASYPFIMGLFNVRVKLRALFMYFVPCEWMWKLFVWKVT